MTEDTAASALFETLKPLTNRYLKDGVATDDFRDATRQQRDRSERIMNMPAEQVKEKMETMLMNGGENFISKFDPDKMTEDELIETAERYECKIEELRVGLNAVRAALSRHIGSFAQEIHDLSPEDVKSKIFEMHTQMETI